MTDIRDVQWSYAESYKHTMIIQEVFCACGCNIIIHIAPRYFNSSCRSRAKRKRDKEPFEIDAKTIAAIKSMPETGQIPWGDVDD